METPGALAVWRFGAADFLWSQPSSGVGVCFYVVAVVLGAFGLRG